MSRSRVTFFLIILLAVGVVVGSLVVRQLEGNQRANENLTATAVLQSTIAAVGVPVNNASNVTPIFAGGKVPTDGLPQYVCAADAFGSYYTLQQMQVAGYDVQNGFHLGIIPFYLPAQDNQYDLSEDARTELLQSGKIDCLFTTLDSIALKGSGVITAIIDESAGADQLWVRNGIKTLNELEGKKIIYASGSVSQFFALYTLTTAGLNPRTKVTMIPADSIESAVKRFNEGQADVISGWLPNVQEAAKFGGHYVIGSDKLRVIVDVIATSRESISKKSPVVQAFHNAWFRTLKAQFEDFPKAAKQVADWGNNEWSGITTANAEKDLNQMLANIAQAGLTQNTDAMKETQRLTERLDTAKRIWTLTGQTPTTEQSAELINSKFITAAAARSDLATSGQPRNTTFLLSSRPNLREIAPNEGETLAVLPCRRFDFLPESTELTRESTRLLDECVVPILSSSTGLYLRVVGSSAWPGPEGTFKEKDIADTAKGRADAVVNYLVSKGIDKRRFNASFVLPPAERRNTIDPDQQVKDRYVEMTLITIGR